MVTHQIAVLLLIGYIVYTIDLKQKYFPVPVVLVLLGMVLSFIPFLSDLYISREIIFNVFLPALLFTSAYKFPLAQLKKHIGIITTFSTVGLMATAALLGTAIYFVSDPFISLSLTGAFLLAAILIPTDPVSVTAIIKNSTGKEELADVVEGESMVNDGTSIVLFTIFLSMVQTGNRFSFWHFLSELVLVSAGGILVGLVMGWLASRAIYYTHNERYHVMLTIVLAYGSFYIAHALSVSGVLASVVAGIMMAYEFGRTMTYRIKDSLDEFWEIIEPTILSILFLMIGIRAVPYITFTEWGLAVIIFVLSVFVRFAVLSGLVYAVPAWRKDFKGYASILSLAGIKGTMSVALLLWLETEEMSTEAPLISVAFAAVLLSLILQSVGIYPMTQWLTARKK
ncbi:cation:proton antiporter [Planococcus lenghuensis]|uniref:Sodium:proton antiporter n=1 Tax=Planococcus lenghuensis TaxID=2213202 RepID=A0A1Q2KVQ8_9BACL|nr:sodium:proton antiporter [Planococcus lenghuensis]AQQ52305.1 sodium:proton antiporter [Planococcus lenghuensis]